MQKQAEVQGAALLEAFHAKSLPHCSSEASLRWTDAKNFY